jgi:DNA-binding NtrC family response regulator
MNEGLSENARTDDRSPTDTVSTNGRPDSPSSPFAILLIDDNPAVVRAMEIAFRMAGHSLDGAATPEEAFSRLSRRSYDAVLLDLNFSANQSDGAEGLACLARIMAEDPNACVVVITAHSGIKIAVAAMQAGARDFAMKPWRNAEMIAKVEAAIARGRTSATAVSAPIAARGAAPRLLGESQAMQQVRDLIRRVAPTSAGVTITGLSGTGRMLAALAIHAGSRDADMPPLRIDLRDEAAWPLLDTLSGTVILRHADQLDPVAQQRLLDRLPPGPRCIAIADSTTALIPALRRRIATVEIELPTLEARGDDAILLARHFAQAAAEQFGRPAATLTSAAEAAIRATRWPDQVRGLALAIERAVLLAEDGSIDAAALALPTQPVMAHSASPEPGFDLSDAEKVIIQAALREHRHNVTQAATALGLSRGALYRRMARYGL